MQSNTQHHKAEIKDERAEEEQNESDVGNHTTLQNEIKRFFMYY